MVSLHDTTGNKIAYKMAKNEADSENYRYETLSKKENRAVEGKLLTGKLSVLIEK